MPTVPHSLAIDAQQLQNAYAYAVDPRDWVLFRTLFTPDVSATYAGQRYDGLDAWLDFFIPFNDTCTWTRHEMTNHLVGEDDHGPWALCYGHVEWSTLPTPELVNTSQVLYRDRLVVTEQGFVISERSLDLIRLEQGVPLPASVSRPNSILSLHTASETR